MGPMGPMGPHPAMMQQQAMLQQAMASPDFQAMHADVETQKEEMLRQIEEQKQQAFAGAEQQMSMLIERCRLECSRHIELGTAAIMRRRQIEMARCDQRLEH